jgi:hypothetical protein
MQSINSLRELNAKLLTEIAKLRKENAKISELKRRMLSLRIRMLRSLILKGSLRRLSLRKLSLRPGLPSF